MHSFLYISLIFSSHCINGNKGGDYIGEFINNDYNGQGAFYWKEGRKYVGQFRELCRYGKGIQYTNDGTIEREGDWIDENPVCNY